MKTIAIILIIIILLVSAFDLWKNIKNREPIYKKAVTVVALIGKDFIVCKYSPTTGSNWIVVNENGLPTYKNCNIVGDNIPFQNGGLPLNYEFEQANNTFVFYVTEKKDGHQSDYNTDIEYTVSGWDILYPVRRDNPFSSSPSLFIIETDLKKST